jgi:uncharacterized protein YrrD
MLKGKQIIGNPIIAESSGDRIGTVQDVLIDPYSNQLGAFFLKKRLSRGAAVVLPWIGVKAVEPGRVITWAPTMLVKADELFDLKQLISQGTISEGTRFKTSDGQFLGSLFDFYFEEQSGAIVGYDVVGGVLTQSERDHAFLPAPDRISFDKDRNVVQIPVQATSMNVDADCRPHLFEAFQRWIRQAEDTALVTPQPLATVLLQHAVGCRVQRTVVSEDGYIIAAEGQPVTRRVIEDAGRNQAEADLLKAVL